MGKGQRRDLNAYRWHLGHKAVLIQCLNEDKELIRGTNSSGFIVKEKNNIFLYTCWHVVTGFDMNNLELKKLPDRKYLQVNLQKSDIKPGRTSIGGNQSTIISLYNEKNHPLWQQTSSGKQDFGLNNINIKLPEFDCVKIPLSNDLLITDFQYIDRIEDRFPHGLPLSGEKVHIVGFPYGYSVLGMTQPQPIVLTRFVASWRCIEKKWEYLIDGPGTPGMSGSPVFIEKDNRLYLLGIYTGLIFPDHIVGRNERTTALGTVCSINLFWMTEDE